MQLERQLRPEVYGRRRGGFLDRRRTRTMTLPQGIGLTRVTGTFEKPRWRTPTSKNTIGLLVMWLLAGPVGK